MNILTCVDLPVSTGKITKKAEEIAKAVSAKFLYMLIGDQYSFALHFVS